MTEFFDFNPKLVELAEKAEALCKPAFERIDKICEHNSQKVLSAFINNKVSESMLHGTTGYGYGDMGRDALDAVYASALGGEDALVRHLFVNGTHTLAVSLFGVLRPGDRIVMCCGAPYDTLEEIIGKRGKKGSGSLIDLGVEYEEVDLLPNGMPDLERISERTKGAKVAYIQRSRGYSTRPSYRI
ncbi:MAG: methionine gamma-lyase family protein, partial [Oscillospiraceae bacterium]|nr:methionine gamma-lyase family protein [Oscillospiraceae bacterium]